MPDRNLQQGDYRRGVMLGLTLAELLLLLLFLFLLVATSLLFKRDELYKELHNRFVAINTERMAFRTALADELGLDRYGARVLTQEELKTPLAAIRDLAQQRDDLAGQLKAAQSELIEVRKPLSPTAQEASDLREKNEALKNMLDRSQSDASQYAKLKKRASALDPKTDPNATIASALDHYAEAHSPHVNDPLGECRAELNNANSRFAHAEAECRSGDYPPCVYRDDGKAAYVYDVDLTQAGAVLHPGDRGQFEQIPWVAALPKLPLDQVLSASGFIAASLPYKLAGDHQTPACRFYIRVHDNMGSASREDFENLYLAVQSNFYHHLER